MWTRVSEGCCTEFTTLDPAGRHHPDVVWLAVPERLAPYANSDYRVVDGAVVPPSLDYARAQIADALAARRWTEQQRGALWRGHRIQTDLDSRASLVNHLVVGERIVALTGSGRSGYAIDWKALDGFVTLALDDLSEALIAATARINDCFAREAEIRARLGQAETIEDVLSIAGTELGAGWPV